MGEVASLAPVGFEWRHRRFVERAMVPLYALLLAELLALTLLINLTNFRHDPAVLVVPLREIALVVPFAWCVRWSGFPRVAAYLELFAVTVAGGLLSACGSIVLHSAALPLADGALRVADRIVFGFDRNWIAGAANRFPAALTASNWVYHSAALSVQLVLVLLTWRRGPSAAARLVLAMQLALICAVVVSALVPAYGTPPYAYTFRDVLDGVRSGTIRRIDAHSLTGIVTFPSLHAAGGALLALGFAQVGRAALPLVALNILMVASAVTSGGHYLVDVTAGLMLAAAAYAVAMRLIPSGPPPPGLSAS